MQIGQTLEFSFGKWSSFWTSPPDVSIVDASCYLCRDDISRLFDVPEDCKRIWLSFYSHDEPGSFEIARSTTRAPGVRIFGRRYPLDEGTYRLLRDYEIRARDRGGVLRVKIHYEVKED